MNQDSNPNEAALKTYKKNPITRVLGTPLFWVLFAAFGFSFPVVNALLAPEPDKLPVYGAIEDFELNDQLGRTQKFSRDLRGQILVVNFIFTRCPDVCPMLTQQMEKLQRRFGVSGPAVRLLSITVDPEFDQPDVLAAYAENFGAKAAKWLFLTGDLEQIRELVVDSFKVAMDIKDEDTDLMDVTHGEHFVILDQLGQLRAYRPARNESDLNRIVKDVSLLINSRPEWALDDEA